MTPGKRPLSVTIIAYIYIAVGAIGFVFHLKDLPGVNGLHSDEVWAELTELLAVICGVFLLRGRNWARWLAFAWIAFHVILSIHELPAFAIHSLLCATIAWFLFRPEAGRYFHRAREKSV